MPNSETGMSGMCKNVRNPLKPALNQGEYTPGREENSKTNSEAGINQEGGRGLP